MFNTLFLYPRKAVSDKSRKNSSSSNNSHQPPSRKMSENSQGSSPSPHPPFVAPDPFKPSRRARSRSPNVSPPMEQKPPKMMPLHQKDPGPTKHSVNRSQPKHSNSSNHVPQIVVGTPPSKNSPILPRKNTHHHIDRKPKIEDSGIYVSFKDAPKVEQIEIYQNMSNEKCPGGSAPDVPQPSQVCRLNPYFRVWKSFEVSFLIRLFRRIESHQHLHHVPRHHKLHLFLTPNV